MSNNSMQQEPKSNSSKFPSWIVYIIFLGLVAFGKGVAQGCIRQKVIHDATEKYKSYK